MAAGLTKQYSAAFFSGVGGRVLIDGNVVVFIKEWSLEINSEIYGAPTFESPVNDGLAWDVKRFIGLSEAKVELTGYALNRELISREIVIGALVALQLYVNADRGLSITVPGAVVQNVSYSQDATATSPAELKISLEVNGPVTMFEG
jgi:hypothetical protein